MAGVDTNLAAAALAIALVALFTTLAQLLQQYFATADGYRRCQKSVMGEYARKTRLHWRWREFRFETLYTTPELFLSGDGAAVKRDQALLTGSEASREATLVPANSVSGGGDDLAYFMYNADGTRNMDVEKDISKTRKRGYRSTVVAHAGEMACWVHFLNGVHDSVRLSLSPGQRAEESLIFPPPKTRLPAVIFRERSWDFQPPDVVRPLAKTTLADIAVIARRMGMRWKDFRPSEGILRAEGNSHIITSTVVRSLGIVLQYSNTGQGKRLKLAEQNLGTRGRKNNGLLRMEKEEVYVPRAKADSFGCGVLRTDRNLDLPHLTISTQKEIIVALGFLDRSGASSAALSALLKENPQFHFRVADIVAFTSPMIRYRGSDLVQVPAPSDNLHGFTRSPPGRRAFHECLSAYVNAHQDNVGEQTLKCLHICRDLAAEFGEWQDLDEEEWRVTRDEKYLDVLDDHVMNLTICLGELEEKDHSFRYVDLLGCHIKFGMFCEGGETSMLRNWGTDYKADVEGYFKHLSEIVDEMRGRCDLERAVIVDVWVTMMLRGMCWGACHFFVPGERVPIEFFGSQLPVYIG